MKCTDCQNLFTDYLSGEIRPETKQQVASHLASCDSCIREWDYFQKTVRLLEAVQPSPVPGALIPGIHEKLDRREQAGPLSRLLLWLQETDFSMSLPAATATIAIAFLTMTLIKHFPMQQFFPGETPQDAQSIAAGKQQDRAARPGPAVQAAPAFKINSNEIHHVTTGKDLDPISSDTPADMFASFLTQNPHAHTTKRTVESDIMITVTPFSQGRYENLCQQILHNNSWQAKVYNDGLVLLDMAPNRLSELRHILTHHKTEFHPAGADRHASFGAPRRTITVAILPR